MRVLMTTDTVGGVWTYTREMVEGLADRGHTVTLVSMGGRPSPDQLAWTWEMHKTHPHLFRFFPTEWKLEWMQDGHGSFDDSCAWLLKLIEREKPGIVHSNQLGYGALPVEVPKLVTVHSDVVSWWRARHNEEPPLTAWMARYREIARSGLLCADAVVAPTAWMRDRAIEHYAAPRSRFCVIPNGRRSVAATANKKMQAVTAGRLWDEGKNIAILGEVRAGMPVYVAGDAAPPDANHASTQPLSDDVVMVGRLPEAELRRMFAESAIYLATSRYEPFGLSALEAALAGCAIVANDIPSFREVWSDAAIYYRCNDPEDLSSVLQRLAQDAAEVEAAGRLARERALRLYTVEAMVNRYIALYSTLVERSMGSEA